ncbi:MAG TPA: hypothetical protein VKF59_01070, partial [Candidatus Dormibacteraeota bacterium]|nr:hypothetical protein [Candidatus Dormibacteraeota bacterium]
MTETTSTPAETEQRAYDDTGGARGVLAIRDDQFARAPAYIPQQEEWAGLKEMARSMSVTEFVPKEMRGRPFAVLGALLTGRDLGLPPMMALRRIYVVNGRPSLEGAVKVALVRQRGHKVTVVPGEWDNEHCTVRGWRKGDSPDEVMEVTYTIDDAKQAGDYDKQGDTYKKRPRQMLYWRAAGLLCDTYFPDVTLGIPDPEEAAGMEPEVLEARFVEADRRGELPAVPPTEEEQAAREVERAAESEERLKAAMVTPPPPPPRRGGRSP